MISTKKTTTNFFFEEAKEMLNIPHYRAEILLEMADLISEEYVSRNKINLNFICTHNSRRSQLAQVWSFYAADYFNLPSISSFSGGTAATSFHRNTIKALQQAGFEFHVNQFSHQNPIYLVSYKGCKNPLKGFSKTFDHPENSFPYIAITTCDDADENCPFIPDAIERFHLPFMDPKISDNTPQVQDIYIKTCYKIAGEIFIIFERIKANIT